MLNVKWMMKIPGIEREGKERERQMAVTFVGLWVSGCVLELTVSYGYDV